MFRPTTLVLALVVLLSACVPARRELTPADMLPADATVSVATGVRREMRDEVARWSPETAEAMDADGPMTIAILRSEDGGWGWVRFTPDGASTSRFPYKVAASDPATEARVGTGAALLSASAAYTTAVQLQEGETPWLFRAQPHGWTSVTWGTGSIRIAVPGQLPGGIAPAFTVATEEDVMTIGAGGIATFLAALPFLPQDTRIAGDALLRTALVTHVGDAASVRGDLLPLLAEPFLLSLQPAETTAEMPFILQGSSSDATEIIDRLHAIFRTSTPPMSAAERVFDGRFTARNIRIDPTAVEEKTFEQNGWNVRATLREDGATAFVSALQGNRFILGSREDGVVRTMIGNDGGKDARSALTGQWTPGALPPGLRALVEPLNRLAGDNPTAVRWTVESAPGAILLTIAP